jgi:hypothetical protein
MEINNLQLENFIKLVKSADFGQEKQITIDIKTAKQIVYNLSLLLLKYNNKLENQISNSQEKTEEVIKINLDGGKGW